jgi:hypothetical protein
MELVKQVSPQKIETYESVYPSRELALDELEATMKELKNDKSLGPNGLAVEFCKRMWDVVSLAYLELF